MRKQTSKSSSIWGVDSLFGIYIHIPFCKKACTYCDFHFSTAIQSKKPVLKAINSELILRKDEYSDVVDSIYFGGGTPTGSFGGALVQTASEGQINMSNAGDFITLADASENVVLTFDVEPLSNNPNESYTRNPDLTGEFVQHAGVDEANGALFSPGTKLDGTSL